LLLATAIFAIVLIAINTVFFAGMRLRRTVSEAVEKVAPINEALAILRRDLQNAVPPGGTMAGDFRSGGPASSTGSSSSSRTTGSSSGGGLGSSFGTSGGGQNGGLDFFASTGLLDEDEPWGDIQEVNYQLMEAEDQPNAPGRDLVRSVTRNLLAASTQTAEVQRLVSNVESLDFFYYDGTQWRETWDTSTSDSGLPTAVRVRIQLATTNLNTDRNLEPMEMVVLLTAQSATNQTSTSTSTSTEGTQ
jgi:hypothetical protein